MGLNAPEPSVFRGQFRLHYPDADGAGFVKLTSLLNLLQVQATEHAAANGVDHKKNKDEGSIWVLSRLSARFESWPTWPCTMTVDTWVRGTKAILLLRDFRFGTDDNWTGRGTTAWVLLKDRKPQRPEGHIRAGIAVRPEEPLVEVPAALPPFEEPAHAEHKAQPQVRHSHGVYADWEDLDLSGHVNNVNAMGWCLSLHDYDFLSQWRPEFLEANFLAEMFCGQKFSVVREQRPSAEDRRTFDYLVLREPDQVVALRLRITFR